ncbi:MAG: hypothetical protein QXP56_04670 [Archaeoglobaceae archaeon]
MREGDFRRMLREISQSISQFNNRLNELENRLSQNSSLIMEERKIPDFQGNLGGRSFSTNRSGGIEKVIRIPVCDVCGEALAEKFSMCKNCGKKLCENCAIHFSGQKVCLDCLKQQLPLSKRSFKVLLALANGIESLREISQVVQVKREEVEDCLGELQGLGLIDEKGLSIFSRVYVTDKGLEAMVAAKILSRD